VFAEKKLWMPVLALGGQPAVGGGLVVLIKEMVDRVESREIESYGHLVMEKRPKNLRGDHWICFKRWSRDNFRREIKKIVLAMSTNISEL
jgi:hypothetical protein